MEYGQNNSQFTGHFNMVIYMLRNAHMHSIFPITVSAVFLVSPKVHFKHI